MLVDANDDSCVPLSGPGSSVDLRAAAAQHRRRGGEDPLPVLRGPPLCRLTGHGSQGGGVDAGLAACQSCVPFLNKINYKSVDVL